MLTRGFGRRRGSHFEPPLEMRFVDLFMIIVTALMFVTVMLSIISAFVGSARIDVAPRVATTALPAALLDRAYYVTLAGVGGANPYTWRITDGALPVGLALDPATGVISGTPLVLQRVQFTAQLTDAERRSDTRAMTLQVESAGQTTAPEAPQLIVQSPAVQLPDAQPNAPYNFAFAANNGTPPYQWTLTGGKLPPGLNLTPSGEVVGTPTTENSTWNFTVTATDATGARVSQAARLFVKPQPPALWLQVLGWFNWGVLALGYITLALILYYVFFYSSARTVTEIPEHISVWDRIRGK